jgi:hypothetical protein
MFKTKEGGSGVLTKRRRALTKLSTRCRNQQDRNGKFYDHEYVKSHQGVSWLHGITSQKTNASQAPLWETQIPQDVFLLRVTQGSSLSKIIPVNVKKR